MQHTHCDIERTENSGTAHLQQEWDRYTVDDHFAWAELYRRRMESLKHTGSRAVLEGIDSIGLSPTQVPDLRQVNTLLAPRTGWRAVPTAAYLEAGPFFASLARREFPTTITVRPLSSLDYIPEPDIFHDVFGHVPLHADPAFAETLQRVGQLAAHTVGERLTWVQRFFWFSIEFGLIRENGATRIYGSGLVSSIGEERHALSALCEHRRFTLDDVIHRDFDHTHVQPVLFVVDSFDHLRSELEKLEMRIIPAWS